MLVMGRATYGHILMHCVPDEKSCFFFLQNRQMMFVEQHQTESPNGINTE